MRRLSAEQPWRLFPRDLTLHPTAKRLLAARTLRSVAQGALVVDLSLYLNALHWSGLAIGLVLTGGGLCAALSSIGIGLMSDR